MTMSSPAVFTRSTSNISPKPMKKKSPPVSQAALDFRLLFAIQKIISSTCGADSIIKGMEDLAGHVHTVRLIHLTSGVRFLLKIGPATNVELLRHERHCLAAEAFTFALLAKSKLPIPQILKYDAKNSHLGSSFLLTTHLPGISYASVQQYLTRSERSGIERQLQSLRSIIAQHTSPKFGSVALTDGYNTWREAFLAMLESVLMDGEDKLVSLPYSLIREEAQRFGHTLDAIKQARLVIAGMGEPENVLIDRRTNEVTGLTDFGRAVWADPELLDFGVRRTPKFLLYICYNSVVTIITNNYRPRNDAKELDARKALTTALAELSCLET